MLRKILTTIMAILDEIDEIAIEEVEDEEPRTPIKPAREAAEAEEWKKCSNQNQISGRKVSSIDMGFSNITFVTELGES